MIISWLLQPKNLLFLGCSLHLYGMYVNLLSMQLSLYNYILLQYKLYDEYIGNSAYHLFHTDYFNNIPPNVFFELNNIFTKLVHK